VVFRRIYLITYSDKKSGADFSAPLQLIKDD